MRWGRQLCPELPKTDSCGAGVKQSSGLGTSLHRYLAAQMQGQSPTQRDFIRVGPKSPGQKQGL